MLDPRVEVCIVVYSDAICAYNDIQAEADKSHRDIMKKKEDIEERLERSRNSRKHFLEEASEPSNSITSLNSQSSQNSIIVEDDGPWYPGKLIMKHFSSGDITPSPTSPTNQDKSDEVDASVWRSIAQELLDFEVELYIIIVYFNCVHLYNIFLHVGGVCRCH